MELTDRLRQTITEGIDNLPFYKLASGEPLVDMLSVEGFERTLVELIEKKGPESLKSETISSAVPRLFFRMLQEISKHPALKDSITSFCRNILRPAD